MTVSSPDEMIVAIIATLNAAIVAGGGVTTGAARIGRKAREQARTGISIVWDDVAGEVAPPTGAGGNARGETEGNNPRIHSIDHARYDVIVRAGTRAATRTMFENLLAATHRTYPNRRQVMWKGYAFEPDEYTHDGWCVKARVEISMLLTDTIVPVIECAAFVGDVILLPQGEVVEPLPTTTLPP